MKSILYDIYVEMTNRQWARSSILSALLVAIMLSGTGFFVAGSFFPPLFGLILGFIAGYAGTMLGSLLIFLWMMDVCKLDSKGNPKNRILYALHLAIIPAFTLSVIVVNHFWTSTLLFDAFLFGCTMAASWFGFTLIIQGATAIWFSRLGEKPNIED